MNLQHLKYALEVEKTGSISKAAENLYINQPHLSKSIRELEANIGISIFDRTSKGVLPTKKGAEFLVYARNIVSQIEEVENMYKQDAVANRNFNISVPMACYVAQAFIEFVKDVADSENMCIHYTETNSLVAINNVTSRDNNIAIIRYQTIYEKYFLQFLEENSLEIEPLWEFSYHLIMSVNHPLAMKKTIKCEELDDYIQITHGYLTIPSLPPSKAREMAQSEIPKREIAVYERESQFMLLKNIHNTFMLASPTPASIMNTMPLVQKKCNIKNNKYKDVIICRKDYHKTEQEKLFIQKVKDEISKLQNFD